MEGDGVWRVKGEWRVRDVEGKGLWRVIGG